MFGIDQFVVHRRGVSQHTEPAKGIHALEDAQHITWNGLARHTVKTITAGNVIAVQAPAFAVSVEGDVRRIGFHVMGLHIADAVKRLCSGALACCHQVAGNFSLTVDHHAFAAGQAFEVDVDLPIIQRQIKAVMHQAFSVHALTDPGLAQ